MPRRRRVLVIALLLALLGAGGGYWVAHREPGPVLRTITLLSTEPRFVTLDERGGRLYVSTADPANPVSALDIRTGNPGPLLGAFGPVQRTPGTDYQSGHAFIGTSQIGKLQMIDMRTNALIRTIAIPSTGGDVWGAIDEAHDRYLLTFHDAPVFVVIDPLNQSHAGTRRFCRLHM